MIMQIVEKFIFLYLHYKAWIKPINHLTLLSL